MSFFKNKHVITAIIVAPVLAIASYFLVDLAVKEQPLKAVAGNAYKLLANSNCRFNSGKCDLENGSFKSTLRVSEQDGKQVLSLISDHGLQTASVGFVFGDGTETGPFEMTAQGNNEWVTNFTAPADVNTVLRVALAANGAHYYSETTMGFSKYQTSFSKDFRNENSE